MKLAYEWDMGGIGDGQTEAGLLEIADGESGSGFMKSLLDNFKDSREQIDELISENLHSWTMDRLSKVDLAILRIAVSEMLMKTTPVSIVVSEAVKIAEEYSTDNAGSFINGVLGSIGRSGKV